MPSPPPDYTRIYSHLVAKAGRDAKFRRALLAQPKATVAKELASAFPEVGPIPESVKITVVEQTKDNITIALPPLAPADDDELTDTELKAIAGSTSIAPDQYQVRPGSYCD